MTEQYININIYDIDIDRFNLKDDTSIAGPDQT